MKVIKAYIGRRSSVEVARMLPRWDELKTHGTDTPVTAVHDCFVLELTNILIGDVSACVRLGEVAICVCLVELNQACPQVFDLFAN
jgi:hypothetical protein